MAEIPDLLNLDCLTVNGKTLGKNLEGARVVNPDVIRGARSPLDRKRRHGDSLRQSRTGWSGHQDRCRRPRFSRIRVRRSYSTITAIWKRASIVRT